MAEKNLPTKVPAQAPNICPDPEAKGRAKVAESKRTQDCMRMDNLSVSVPENETTNTIKQSSISVCSSNNQSHSDDHSPPVQQQADSHTPNNSINIKITDTDNPTSSSPANLSAADNDDAELHNKLPETSKSPDNTNCASALPVDSHPQGLFKSGIPEEPRDFSSSKNGILDNVLGQFNEIQRGIQGETVMRISSSSPIEEYRMTGLQQRGVGARPKIQKAGSLGSRKPPEGHSPEPSKDRKTHNVNTDSRNETGNLSEAKPNSSAAECPDVNPSSLSGSKDSQEIHVGDTPESSKDQSASVVNNIRDGSVSQAEANPRFPAAVENSDGNPSSLSGCDDVRIEGHSPEPSKDRKTHNVNTDSRNETGNLSGAKPNSSAAECPDVNPSSLSGSKDSQEIHVGDTAESSKNQSASVVNNIRDGSVNQAEANPRFPAAVENSDGNPSSLSGCDDVRIEELNSGSADVTQSYQSATSLHVNVSPETSNAIPQEVTPLTPPTGDGAPQDVTACYVQCQPSFIAQETNTSQVNGEVCVCALKRLPQTKLYRKYMKESQGARQQSQQETSSEIRDHFLRPLSQTTLISTPRSTRVHRGSCGPVPELNSHAVPTVSSASTPAASTAVDTFSASTFTVSRSSSLTSSPGSPANVSIVSSASVLIVTTRSSSTSVACSMHTTVPATIPASVASSSVSAIHGPGPPSSTIDATITYQTTPTSTSTATLSTTTVTTSTSASGRSLCTAIGQSPRYVLSVAPSPPRPVLQLRKYLWQFSSPQLGGPVRSPLTLQIRSAPGPAPPSFVVDLHYRAVDLADSSRPLLPPASAPAGLQGARRAITGATRIVDSMQPEMLNHREMTFHPIQQGGQFWHDLLRTYNWGGSDENPPDGRSVCRLCQRNLVEVLLFQCHHRVVCYSCVRRINTCPTCGSRIELFTRLNR